MYVKPGRFRSGGGGGVCDCIPQRSDQCLVCTLTGSLLAVPTDVAKTLTMETVPGRKILAALTTYGGYIADDTADNTFSLCTTPEVISELLNVYNFTVSISEPLQPTSPFFKDLHTAFAALHAVTNNAQGSVGGGGTPLGPIAPEICP